jgi:hypothetical protein
MASSNIKTAPGTQAILDLEDRAPDVLGAVVDGSTVPLWLQVRNAFAIELNEQDFDVVVARAEAPRRSSAWLGLARSFVPSRWDVASARGSHALCFLVGGGTTFASDGAERNWLISNYVDRFERESAVIQWRPLPGPRGRPAHSATWSLAAASTRAAGFARLSHRDPEPQVRAIVSEIARELDAGLSDQAIESIQTSAVYHERLRPFIDRALLRFVELQGATTVIMEDASYGTWAASIAALKGAGVRVAELQHGWIGPTHASYNYGTAGFDTPLRNGLPDELLTFGDYWSQGLRFPGRITPIGKPHLEDAAGHASPLETRREILVVSSTTDPVAMVDFVTRLRSCVDAQWTVVFRPHPSEFPTLSERYGGLVDLAGVTIDRRPDVYEALAVAAAVVGVASTVLFEARAFGCAVFVLESALTDYYVGDRLGDVVRGDASAGDLARRIDALGAKGESGPSVDHDIWASNAVERFGTWFAERP